jgi:hypothetical protein
MLRRIVQHQIRRPLRTIASIIIVVTVGLLAFYFATIWQGLNLAREYVAIPSDAANLNAFYVGIGQSHTIYVRFDLTTGSEDEFLSELCGERFTNIDADTNPFRDVQSGWWMPSWWNPPNDSLTYVGGECYGRAIYRIFIDKTNEATSTAYISVSL